LYRCTTTVVQPVINLQVTKLHVHTIILAIAPSIVK
jgi:hypothetical protein